MKINLLTLLLLGLLGGCTHTQYKPLPEKPPAPMPAELEPPAEFPLAIQKLNDWLKAHSMPEVVMPED